MALPAAAQPALYASAVFSKDYVVGAKLNASGLFRCGADGECEHLGYNLPILTTFMRDPQAADTLLLAAGNGLIRASAGGREWAILTSHDVTELRDVAVHPASASTYYFAHTHGVRMTRDGGKTWTEMAASRKRRFTEAIRVTREGAVIAGTEDGLYRTEDNGAAWRLVGAAGYGILRLEGSPHDACMFVAATQGGGLFASADCGRTFESIGRALGVGRNIYSIAFDPAVKGRIAVGGFGPGVAVSEDNGKTWQIRNSGLPAPEVTAVVFDPAKPGRLLAAIHENALYASDDAGVTWRKHGMEGSHVNDLRFLEVRR